MKILHLCTGFPYAFPGGITIYVQRLALDLISLGVESAVVCGESTKSSDGDVQLLATQSRMQLFSLNFRDHSDVDAQVIAHIKSYGPDVIHFHTTQNFGRAAYEYIMESRIPYVVTLNDYYYVCPRTIMYSLRFGACRSVVWGKCSKCVGVLDRVDILKNAATRFNIVLPSIKTNKLMDRQGFFEQFLRGASVLHSVSSRVEEIFRGVLPEARYHRSMIGNDSIKYGGLSKSKATKLRCSYIGSLNAWKGAGVFERLVSMADLNKLEFCFYGRADLAYAERLEARGVVMKGSYTPNDLPNILSDTDVGLVLPVWEDNGPQVCMEFINSRTPVLGTDRGGVLDFVTSDRGYVFDPDDDSAYSGALSWLMSMTDPVFYSKYKSMPQHVEPIAHAREMITIYNEATPVE